MATTDIFDPVNETFVAGPTTTRPRLGAAAITLRNGRVLVLGSSRGNAEGILGNGPSSAELFSLERLADCCPGPAEFTVIGKLSASERIGYGAVTLTAQVQGDSRRVRTISWSASKGWRMIWGWMTNR